MNTIYYGFNLPLPREYIKDESVDLIYLDPPFNSTCSNKKTERGKKVQAEQAPWDLNSAPSEQ